MLEEFSPGEASESLPEDQGVGSEIYLGVKIPFPGVRYYVILDEKDRTCSWTPPAGIGLEAAQAEEEDLVAV